MTAALPPEEQLNPDHPANDYPGDFGQFVDGPVEADVETPELEEMDQEAVEDTEPDEAPAGDPASDHDEDGN